MKRIISIALIFILSASYVHADVYVVSDKNSKEIISISDENDCILDGNMDLKILKDKKLDDVILVYPAEYYILKGNKFKPNMEKLQKKEAADLKAYTYIQEENDIRKHYKNAAIDKMIAEGYKFKYDHKE